MSNAIPHTLYPATYFLRAPTYKKWVKLTTSDIQNLRQEPGFAGQNIYFHLNHPVEFVYVLGTVVAIDHLTTKWGTQFSTLEVDDGSGRVLEVKITYQKEAQEVKRAGAGAAGEQTRAQARIGQDESQDADHEDEDEDDLNLLNDNTPTRATSTLSTKTHETLIPDLLITSHPRAGHLITLHGETIEVGTTLKLKGTLSLFRSAFQLNLRRAFVVSTVDEEVAFWEDYASFALNVLSKPWILTPQDVAAVEADMRKGLERERKQILRKREVERRKKVMAEREKEREERWETKRKEVERMEDGNALDRVGWKPCVAPPAPAPVRVEQRPKAAPAPAPSSGTSVEEKQRSVPIEQKHKHKPKASSLLALIEPEPERESSSRADRERDQEQDQEQEPDATSDGFKKPSLPLPPPLPLPPAKPPPFQPFRRFQPASALLDTTQLVAVQDIPWYKSRTQQQGETGETGEAEPSRASISPPPPPPPERAATTRHTIARSGATTAIDTTATDAATFDRLKTTGDGRRGRDIPMAGPSLGYTETSRIAGQIDALGGHSGPWFKRRGGRRKDRA